MNDYNRLISSRILDGYEEMLDVVPQPQMLGGKRMRNYVLPASTEYDYPASLSVGTMDGKYASTLGGSFFRDFNQGFPMEDLAGGASHCGMEGGAYYIDADGQARSTNKIGNPRRVGGKFNIGKAFKSVGKVAAPIAKDLAMTLAKEGIKEGVKSYAKSGAARGGAYYIDADGQAKSTNRRGGKFNIKSIGKAVAPVAKELGMTLAKEGIKEGVKSYAKGGRRKKGILKSVGKVMGSVGKEIGSVGKEVFRDVIVPEGKKALKDYIRESLKARPTSSASSDEMIVGMGRKPRASPRKIMKGADISAYSPEQLFAAGGALIRDDPSQFHSSVYPPALASYAAQMPRGKDAYGRGRGEMKLPKSATKRYTARGAIVAEVMKKHGLNLAQASKFVKEKGLY